MTVVPKLNWEATRQLGKINRWIKTMVSIEPVVMKEVSEMTFGDLDSWIQKGKDNIGVCGCLVGSAAIALINDRNSCTIGTKDYACLKSIPSFLDPQGNPIEAYQVVARLSKLAAKARRAMQTLSEDAGVAVADLRGLIYVALPDCLDFGESNRLADEITIRLIKERIVKALSTKKAQRALTAAAVRAKLQLQAARVA